MEQEVVDRPASHNSSVDLSLPAPSFQKELQDLDEKWSLRMARLEALITMGHKSSPHQLAFSPVKVPVSHQPPPGSISQTPFIQSAALSGQAGPASGLDGAQALPVSTVTRSSRHWRVPESLEREIPVPRSLHPHLLWWTKETNVLTGQPLHPLSHAVQIFTDASKEGWGAHLGHFTARGIWSVPESHLHINFLAYINKEGGMRSGSLCALLW